MNGRHYSNSEPDVNIKEVFGNAKNVFRVVGYLVLLINLPAAVVSLLLSEVLFFIEKQL